jgi:hypothetical protein
LLEEWPIEAAFRRPLLKSLRHVNKRKVSGLSSEFQVLLIDSDADLSGTVAKKYIAWGEEQGWHTRQTCASRPLWYALPQQEHSQILLPKGIWERHFAVLAENGIFFDQQIYQVFLSNEVSTLVAAALLNSAWFALQLELQGRVNFGEGVLWLALYELEDVLLPDPRYLADNHLDQLENTMKELALLPVESLLDQNEGDVWQQLNAIIFDIMGFSKSDRDVVLNNLNERVSARQKRARSV